MIPTLRKFDTGTAIRVAVTENGSPVDLTAATGCSMLFRGPFGNYSQFPATIVTDDDVTKVQYLTAAGDLNCSGIWRVQAHFSLDGWSGTTTENEFRVEEIYE